MIFVKVLIPLKGVLKRVPSAVGGDNNPWVAGAARIRGISFTFLTL